MRRWLAGVFWLTSAGAIEPPPSLPVPVTNNATALLAEQGGYRAWSFNGLLSGRGWQDVTDRAFEYDSGSGRWREIDPVPGGEGRLASIAQVVAGQVYVFGGYTVAEDGSERSIPTVHRFDPGSGRYHDMAPMPVPVDDTVAVVHGGHRIVLISGWHDTDNVDNVQVYDVESNRWSQATPWPGPPLFGHAGGMVGDVMVVCDGVKVVPLEEPGKREFKASNACFLGTMDPKDPTQVQWQDLPPHPGPPRYRMAATGVPEHKLILFAGGSDNPYNYDGIGYDGRPSGASAEVFAWDLEGSRWMTLPALPEPSMDHRNLPFLDHHFLLIGGMGNGQVVLDSTRVYTLDRPPADPGVE